MTRVRNLTRREAIVLGGGAALAAMPRAAISAEILSHGYSPLGEVKYRAGFEAFDYVNASAPKGGTMRLARIGAFDTVNTLVYPGRPPGDIRMIYDRLTVGSADERASYYGALAEGLHVSDDFARIVFRLHPEARWHDGRPLRASDVVFTFDTLKARGAPFYRQAFLPLAVIAESDDRVVFINDRRGDRDVLRRISTIPIHPEHVWGNDPGASRDDLPIGSGPYRVTSVDAPRQLALERVDDYWGRDLSVNRGRWNLDRLVFDYYRDANVALEAFRANDYDVRIEDDSQRWRNGYAGEALSSGAIQRHEVVGDGVGDLHGLVFNLRRRPFADRRVRLALALAYDFDGINRALYAGSLQRFDSVFGTTNLAAHGPAEPTEERVIGRFDDLPPATLATPDPLAGLPPPGTREALAVATRLLREAGLVLSEGRLLDPATDRPLDLRIVSPNPIYERPLGWLEQAWARLGIGVSWGQADPASAARQMLDRDFDLATLSWAPAQLPGTSERLLWHSDLADQDGSYALSGIRHPALDATIEALETARSEDALRAAGRTFDRVFRQLMPMLPLWRSNVIRIAWWNRFGRPDREIEGFPPSPVDRWWRA